MSRPYDVTLNGIGYMLAKSPDGKLLSGASHAQHSDPFANYFSEQERWKLARFGLSGGAGAKKWSGGEDRYMWGSNIDSRSGDIIQGPHWTYSDGGTYGDDLYLNTSQYTHFLKAFHTVTDRDISSWPADVDGWALKFTGTNGKYIRSVMLLIKRHPDFDYSGATAFDVDIRTDVAGLPNPAASLATTTVSLEVTPDEWLPHEDLYRKDKYFWVEVNFTYAGRATLPGGAPATYWLCVRNANNTPMRWGCNSAIDTDQAEWDGANWSAKADEYTPFAKIKYDENIDALVRKFCVFRGASTLNPPGGAPATGDDVERLYAAVGPKVMYFNEATQEWLNSESNFTGDQTILDMIAFNNGLFVCQGDGADMYYSDGASATTTWIAVTGRHAQCLGLHDNMLWKGEGAQVQGSLAGTAWFDTGGVGTVSVGDPGTPIISMSSHGGKLYCAKPEGIFEVAYPDLYPTQGTPTCNQVLDFGTDKSPRPFLLDWHSGLYFPGTGGLYEWKSSILTDVWKDSVDIESAQWPGQMEGPFGGYWQAAAGATRGMVLAVCAPFEGKLSQLSVFEGGTFYPLVMLNDQAEHYLSIFVQSLGGGRGRLWFGHGTEICWCNWPTWTDDREIEEESSNYYLDLTANIGMVRLPLLEGERPEQKKDWHEIRFRTRNAGNTNADGGVLMVYYRDTDENVWHSLHDNLSLVDTSPYQALQFDAGTSGYLLDLIILFTLDWVGGQTANVGTVRLEEIVVTYQPLPDTVSTFQLYVQGRKNAPLHGSGVDKRDTGEIYTALLALLEVVEPFTYNDEFGVDHQVRALGVSKHDSRFIESDGAQGFDVEGTFIVSLLKISDSAPGSQDAGEAVLGGSKGMVV